MSITVHGLDGRSVRAAREGRRIRIECRSGAFVGGMTTLDPAEARRLADWLHATAASLAEPPPGTEARTT